MRHLIFFALLSIACTPISGQTIFSFDTFESDVLAFRPAPKPGLSDKSLDFAIMVLRETRSATEQYPANFNVADYFNILSVFLTLQESEEHVELAFQKFLSAEGHCQYLIDFEDIVMENDKYKPLRSEWKAALFSCGSNEKLDFQVTAYAKKYRLDIALVQAIYRIKQDDQTVRTIGGAKDWHKMAIVDKRNQQKIDSLFQIHQTYIGKSLVGPELVNVMWLVIQHAPVSFMDRYFEVVH